MDLTAEHLVALLVLAAVTAALCAAARRRPDGPTAALLGAFTIGADAATILAAAALWSRRRALVELLWFWACAGTVQALLTPDVPERFPGLLWFQCYGAHGGIVAAALLLVVGLRLRPRPGAWARAALLTAAYAVAVGAVDLLTGGDSTCAGHR